MTREERDGTSRRLGAWRIAGWSIAALVWLLPLAAMQVTDEVNWTISDFVFAAVLIGGVGLALELAVGNTRSVVYRAAVGLLVAAAFLLVWLNAAVGMIGGEDNPLNLLYGGVLAIALGGAIDAGFQPQGMARAMVAAATAQALVGVVAVRTASDEPPGALGLIGLNGFFVVLFAASAWLFWKAAGPKTLETV